MRFKLFASVVAAIGLSACTSTKQFADIGFRPPEGSYKLIVMRPDISIGLLTAGGSVEHRDDWTDTARGNIMQALTTQQVGRGGVVKIVATREDVGIDVTTVADLDRLHEVVGQSIRVHKYIGLKLPTKTDKFDWTLGEPAVAFG